MKSRIILFIIGFLVWMLLTWPPDGQEGLVGLIIAAVVSAITGDIFATRPYVFGQPSRYLYFLWYIPVFIWECFKANVDVAWRVAHPGMPIKPGIVKVKTGLKSDTALTFLANSITLTPGTMSVDIDRQAGCLYVHWINVREKETEAATRVVVERFERILGKIFE